MEQQICDVCGAHEIAEGFFVGGPGQRADDCPACGAARLTWECSPMRFETKALAEVDYTRRESMLMETAHG